MKIYAFFYDKEGKIGGIWHERKNFKKYKSVCH